MRSRDSWLPGLLATTFLPSCLALLPPAALPPGASFVGGRVLVEFASGTSAESAEQVARSVGASAATPVTADIWQLIVRKGAEGPLIARLMANHPVVHAEVEGFVHDQMVGAFRPVSPTRPYRGQAVVPNPLFNPSGGLPGQWGVSWIHAPDAWNTTQGAGVEVAVVDTGVDIYHPDLVNNLDLSAAANYFDPPDATGKQLPPVDDFGHGTHVAGIIAAELGNIGTVGIAPQAKIVPIRVLGVDGGTSAELVAGLDHVLQTKARIVNLSLGSEQSSAIEQDEINKLLANNIVVVAAAGNEALSGNPLDYPASDPGVISVAATKPPDSSTGAQAEHADFSNFDPFVSVAAPGVDILSTIPGNTASGAASDQGAYAYADGTSMAAPMVSGVVALILSEHPSYTVDQVKRQLFAAAGEPPSIGPGFNSFFGYGVVNAQAAVVQ
ncbi:MAG: S8 family serine peptidase [Cyanobacteria bacterium REEB65]|nr:S8 family serine peptidase [Cyanobacteria bacterium REEB65]